MRMALFVYRGGLAALSNANPILCPHQRVLVSTVLLVSSLGHHSLEDPPSSQLLLMPPLRNRAYNDIFGPYQSVQHTSDRS